MAKRQGRPPTISRADVVDAALRLGRQVGLDRFTISQLADELGVAPMTPYHYVSSRSELVQLVVDELLGRIDIPGPETGPWDVRLTALEASAWRELGGIPGIPAGISPDQSSSARRLADGVLGMLAEAGFDEQTALLAYGALFTYMMGQLELDVAANRGAASSQGARFAALIDRTSGDVRTMSDEIFDFGFSLLLTGLRDVLEDEARP